MSSITPVVVDKNKKTDNVIIFVHLPKTGGNTLHRIIEKQYNTCEFAKWNLSMVSEEKKERIQIVRGHVPFGVHKLLPQNNYIYITILRNPVERIISDFYYVRQQDFPIDKLRNSFNNMTLYDFVTNKDYSYAHNIQTRRLAGKEFILGKDESHYLELAKNNLIKYFSIVGVTERYEETLYVIKKKLGWRIDNYEKDNVTQNKPTKKEIPQKVIEIIKKKNQNDMHLHRLSNQLLDEQLRSIK